MTNKLNVLLSKHELAKFPSENPNCVLRITKAFQVVYKNKAVETLLRECGFKKNEVFKILPQNIKTHIRRSLKTNRPVFDLEVDLEE